MNYISTRGKTKPMGFLDAILTGLAPDGGLLIPDSIPDVREKLGAWSELSYPDLAFEVIRLYADISEQDLKHIINESYAAFRDPAVAPLVDVGPVHILELFHGPTLAFKDVALQFLSRFFEYALQQRDLSMNVLAATSGDTGSAAIHGIQGRDRMNIFVMHPRGRVAPLQEKQMTTVLSPNVFNLAVDGTFDDCQNIMKSLFADLPFKQEYHLGAVNSVNWARILAQIVYYFSSGLQTLQQTGAKSLSFSVPTGNFGNILAGYYARQMGLPIDQLILATNENDILSRVFTNGVYERGNVVHTLSPSMDIQVASNFERYLYYLLDEDPERVNQAMETFQNTGRMVLPKTSDESLDDLYLAGSGNREQTLAVIKRYYADYGYILDPHTAVGVYVAEQKAKEGVPVICLATAHPAKFPDAIDQAIGTKGLARHPILEALDSAPTQSDHIEAEKTAVMNYIQKRTAPTG